MSYKSEILVAEARDFSPRAAESLRAVGRLRLEDLSYSDLLSRGRDAEVLWVRLRSFIGAEALDAMPRLRTIVTATTGLNHLDLAAAGARGVEVLSLRGETAFLEDVRATAEHTIGLLLALLRKLPAACRAALDGRADRDDLRGGEIRGKTVGLVGYGRLGRIVARYLTAFDARVLATDRRRIEPPVGAAVSLVPLDRLLAESDVVSLHASCEDDNRGFFDRACFDRMKPGAYFINTARGELVDEAALLEALEAGRLAGAAVDVLADEARVDAVAHPLIAYARRHENLLLTPHIGGSTVESLAMVEEHMARRLTAHLQQAAHSPRVA